MSRTFWMAVAVAAHLANASAQSLTTTTLAGPRETPGAIDGNGTAARFDAPYGLANDSGGNIYVAEAGVYGWGYTIRKITSAGAVMTLAGKAGVVGTNDGTGIDARFWRPWGVAVANDGTVYVIDERHARLRKVTQSGVVTTFAGQQGEFIHPIAVTVDSVNNAYVLDANFCSVLKVSPAGVVSVFAGAYCGAQDGTGSGAAFYYPRGITIDGSDNLYVTDNSTIRKVTPGAVVTTLAGLAGSTGSADGTGSAARFNGSEGIDVDVNGNLYVADKISNTIRKVTPAGVVTTLAGSAGTTGSADGTGSAARFNGPMGVAVDASGNVYVGDSDNFAIRKITSGGVVTTFAGAPGGFGTTDGTGEAARFQYPYGVAAAGGGTAYVADTFNHTIRKITSGGVVTTFAGVAGTFGYFDGTGTAARFYNPKGIVTDGSGNVYVTDTNNHTIRKITSGGAVTTLAGQYGLFGSADGTGTAARFKRPVGIAVDSNGNLFVADTENNTIRKVTSGGVVTTIAGLAGNFGSADGTGNAARFSAPRGIAVDGNNDIFVADTGNNTIRKVTQGGVVTTVAGLAGNSGSTDGNGSSARFNEPAAITADGSNNLFICDRSNHTIRRLTPSGDVTTVASVALGIGQDDGTGAAARFDGPHGLDFDSSGNLYIADTGNHAIRLGVTAIADVATIDAAQGSIGSVRQLNTSPQTASSWQWTFIRRPANCNATFSSSTIRNPTFTPDVTGAYTFRLVATYASGTTSSITTVDLNATAALPAPTGFSATATSYTNIALTWTAVPGATGYEIYRSLGTGEFTFFTSVSGTTYNDSTVFAYSTYLYKVRAMSGGSPSAFSAVDVATTTLFTDDPLSAGMPMRAAHVTELRTAINSMRTAAGLAAASYTNTVAAGSLIRASDIAEMRTALNAARSILGLTAIAYGGGSLATGAAPRVAHIVDLRNGVK